MWFNVLSGDDRSAWDPRLMPDPRVSHFWDVDREAYSWFPDHEGYRDLIFGPVAWDIFFLYGPEATWDDIPWPVVSSGSTIIRKRQDLADGLRSLLGGG